MSLEDLNEKLHGRDAHLDRTRQHTPYDPGYMGANAGISSEFQRQEDWHDAMAQNPASAEEILFADISTRKRHRNIAFFVGGIATLMLLVGLVFQVRSMLFNEENVTVAITGPQNVASAESTTFTVTYTNDNWAGLANATLVISYPESFHPEMENTPEKKGLLLEIPLGNIDANTAEKKTFSGKFYGSKGDLVYLKATLRYTPSSVTTVFEKSAQVGVNVATAPLALEIEAPLELATGQDVEYVVNYSNVNDLPFSNLRVKMEYPDGFQLVSAEPRPSEGESVWYIGTLHPRAEGKIVVRGVLSGTRDERKQVHGMIGFFGGDGKFIAYAENERQTRMIASPFSLSQTVNGLTAVTAHPGETLHYVIRYKNESDIGMRDAIVTVEINPTLLDMTRLSLNKGSYDASRKLILWKASDIPSLGKIDPGASGEISFSVPVVATLPQGSGNNASIRSVAKIDSPDIPTTLGANKIVGSNMLLIKLNPLINVETSALYNETPFQNTGPFPPQVGQKTSYTIRVRLSGVSNNVKDARFSFFLPTGTRYEGTFAPPTETVRFNERTNEIVWELGALTPTENTARDFFFQIFATPAPNTVGKPLILLNQSIFTAEDTFTGQNIRIEKGEVNSFLSADTLYQSLGGSVVAEE